MDTFADVLRLLSHGLPLFGWVMQEIGHKQLPLTDFKPWIGQFGGAVRMFLRSFSYQSIRNVRWEQFKAYCVWFGPRSFHLVALGAVVVSLALTIQCVTELQEYQAQDLSGAVISIGLLRELGPLTISLAWCARVAALIAEESRRYAGGENGSQDYYSENYILVRYLAALAMSVPAGAYGLIVGFVTAALFAPLLGASSTGDFLESARQGIASKDIFTYFLKLLLINPTIGVFAGCICGRAFSSPFAPVAANAVTATFLVGYTANLIVTSILYIQMK